MISVPELVLTAAARFKSAVALVTDSEEVSFAQLGQRVVAAAAVFRALGARPGDRVLMLAANSTALVQGWLGAIYAGLVPAAVNPQLTSHELRELGHDLEPAMVVADAERGRVASHLGSDLGIRTLSLDDLEGEEDGPPYLVDPASPAAIVYTSGTTSRPKGVLVRHSAYTETGRSFPGWIGLGQTERLWACLPLFHINAQAYSLMSALNFGYSLALTSKFHASSFWADARRLRVTAVNLVGAMLTMLERQPEATWVESSLHTVYAAPTPAPVERDELEKRFRIRIVGGYGMTENPFGCIESRTSRAKPGSVGQPRQPASGAFRNHLRISVVQEDREAEVGEVGELWFRNPVMTPGYWNAPEITQRVLAGGWLRTGDAGYRDADGDVILTGRFKEMIRRRGENISPQEVEDALLSHPAVEVAAAFGVPSELGEEEVVAAVVLRPDQTVLETDLRAWVAARLSPYKVPSRIIFRRALPMTATARVAREVLRSDFLESASHPPSDS